MDRSESGSDGDVPAAEIISSLLGLKGPLRFVPHGGDRFKPHLVLKRLDPSKDAAAKGMPDTVARFGVFTAKKLDIKYPDRELYLSIEMDHPYQNMAVVFEGDVADGSKDVQETIDTPPPTSSRSFVDLTKEERQRARGLPPRMRKSWAKKSTYQDYYSKEEPANFGFPGYPLPPSTPRTFATASVQTDLISTPSSPKLLKPDLPNDLPTINHLPSPVSQGVDHETPLSEERFSQTPIRRSLSPMDVSSTTPSPVASPKLGPKDSPRSPMLMEKGTTSLPDPSLPQDSLLLRDVTTRHDERSPLEAAVHNPASVGRASRSHSTPFQTGQVQPSSDAEHGLDGSWVGRLEQALQSQFVERERDGSTISSLTEQHTTPSPSASPPPISSASTPPLLSAPVDATPTSSSRGTPLPSSSSTAPYASHSESQDLSTAAPPITSIPQKRRRLSSASFPPSTPPPAPHNFTAAAAPKPTWNNPLGIRPATSTPTFNPPTMPRMLRGVESEKQPPAKKKTVVVGSNWTARASSKGSTPKPTTSSPVVSSPLPAAVTSTAVVTEDKGKGKSGESEAVTDSVGTAQDVVPTVEASYYRPPSAITSSRAAPVFVRATNLSAWVSSEPPEPVEPPPIIPPPPKRRKSPPTGPAAMRNIMGGRASFLSSNASTSSGSTSVGPLNASTSNTSSTSGPSGSKDLEKDLTAGGLFLDGRPRDPTLLRLPTESALKPTRDSLGGGSTSVARVVHALPPKPDGASRSSDLQTPMRRESASWVAPKRERPPSPRLGHSPPPYATPSAGGAAVPPSHASMESFSVPWPVTQSHFVKQIHPSNPRDALVLDQLVLGPKGSRFAAICGEWLYLWETQLPAGSEIVKFKYGCQIASMAWSRDDTTVYVLTEDGQVSSAATVGLGWVHSRLFEVPGVKVGQKMCLVHAKGKLAIAVPNAVRVWIQQITGTWQQQTSIKRAGTTALRFVDDGDALVGGGPDGALWYCTVPNGILRMHAFLNGGIASLDVSPTGSHLLVGQVDGKAVLVTMSHSSATGRTEKVYKFGDKEAPKARYFSSVFATRGQAIVHGSVDGYAVVWDRKKERPVYVLKHSADESIQTVIAYDGGNDEPGWVITGTRGGRLLWWPLPVAQAVKS